MPGETSHIAIVDDDAAVRRALQRLLGASSMDAIAYESGEAFLASLGRHVPVCAIVDLKMPGMTGLELQQKLCARDLTVPVIIITGHDAPGAEQYCLAAGVVAYLRKPVSAPALLAAIARATGRNDGSGA